MNRLGTEGQIGKNISVLPSDGNVDSRPHLDLPELSGVGLDVPSPIENNRRETQEPEDLVSTLVSELEVLLERTKVQLHIQDVMEEAAQTLPEPEARRYVVLATRAVSEFFANQGE